MSIFDKNKLTPIKKSQHLKSHYTILLVDDEPGNLNSLSSLLEDDYTILTAADGESALNIIKTERDSIQLIISDQRMPRMTGTELLTKSLPIIPNAMRIILTGYTDVVAIIEAINQARIYKFMMKPYDHRDMMLTVKRALENYELQQENKILLDELRRLDEEKLEFLRFLSNEFRKPHTSMSLDQTSPPNTVQQVLSQSQTRYKRIQRLVNTVLRYFELSDAKIPINNTNIKLKRLIEYIIEKETHKTNSKNKNITFKNTIEGKMLCNADEIILREVLSHIINNAIKYSDRNGIITISARQTPYHTQISVQDTGYGIDSNHINEIFRPFSFVTGDTNPEGLAMSLPTVALLLKLHGGRIWCNSSGLGLGCEFVIEV